MNITKEQEEEIYQKMLSEKMSAISHKFWDSLSREEKSRVQSLRAKKRWDNYYAAKARNEKNKKA